MRCNACDKPIVSAPVNWENFNLCTACSELRRSVCLLVERVFGSGNRVLAVSRKYDHTKFGLPGGKVDPGESAVEAINREVREETGLTLDTYRPFFIAVCPGGPDGIPYLNLAFLAEHVVGDIHTAEPHVVEWVTRDVLLNGPFGHYNKKLFDYQQRQR